MGKSCGRLLGSSTTPLSASQHHLRLLWLRFGASPLTVKPTRFRAFGLCSSVPVGRAYAQAVSLSCDAMPLTGRIAEQPKSVGR